MRDEIGAVLAFVILVMVAVLVLAHAALVASLSEVAGSRAAVRDLELRSAARWALATTLRGAPGPWRDSLGTWDIRKTDLGPVGRAETSGVIERLGAESWLVSGEARGPNGATARTARLAWALDPLRRVTTLEGLVSVPTGVPLSLAGTADATRPAEPAPPMAADECDPWVAALSARYASAALPLAGPLPDSAASPALGLLDLESLLAAAPTVVSGTGTPTPEESAGTCLVDAPWGWGDPDRPWGSCGGHLPMRAADGDLSVSGGAGQGLLIVRGDLTLTDGARYYGLVIVGGALDVRGGAELTGLALAGGGASLAAGSTLRASACWAVRAIDAQRDRLARLVVVSGSGPMGPW